MASDVPLGYPGIQAETLDLARKQLEQIGMTCNHLPCIFPFSASLPDQGSSGSVVHSETEATPSSTHVASAALQEAINNVEDMDRLYRQIIDRTSTAYLACGRKRIASRLRAGLAALDLYARKLSNHLELMLFQASRQRPTGATNVCKFGYCL